MSWNLWLNFPSKRPKFFLAKLLFSTSSSNSVEKIVTHLLKNGPNIEKSLNTVKAKLDASTVIEVLKRCSIEKPQIGLRFFIWAGIQPSFRFSSYTYSRACDLLQIVRNPMVIYDLIDAYGVENCSVNVKMFKVVLNLCRQARDADLGLWVLKKMKELDCRPDTGAYNMVIRLFCEGGEVEKGMELMREMGLIDLYPDMVTYISMIKGLCEVGKVEDACGLVKVMKGHGCLPNVVVYTAIIDGICRLGNLDRGLEFLDAMEKESGDIDLNTVTYTAVIQGFCGNGRSMEALEILHRMKSFGHKPNRVTVCTLIEGLCKDGCMEEANAFIDEVAGENVSYGDCYSSLLVSLWRIGKFEDAENVYKMMLSRGFRIDGLALSTMVNWLCSERRFLDAFTLYDAFDKSGNVSTIDSDICVSLLNGLSQENQWRHVTKLLSLLIKRGVPLKGPHLHNVVKHLKDSGEETLVSYITLVGGP